MPTRTFIVKLTNGDEILIDADEMSFDQDVIIFYKNLGVGQWEAIAHFRSVATAGLEGMVT